MQKNVLDIRIEDNKVFFIYNSKGDFLCEFKIKKEINDLSRLTAELITYNNGYEMIAIYNNGKVISKQCGICKKILDLDEFHSSKSNFASTSPSCKSCVSHKMKRTIETSLTVEVTREYFIFKDQSLNEFIFNKNLDVSPYMNLRAIHKIDGRGSDIFILYDEDKIIAKQCNSCFEILPLLAFSKHDRSYGKCRPKCKECESNSVRKTLIFPLEVNCKNNTLSINTGKDFLQISLQNHEFDLSNISAEHIICEGRKVNIILIYENNEIILKQCNSCKELKFLLNFHKGSSFGNRNPVCRKCRNKTSMRRNIPIEKIEFNNQVLEGKECTKCKVVKILVEFRNGKGPGEKVSICMECEHLWHKEYREENKDVVSQRKKHSYYKTPEKYRNRVKQNYTNAPESWKEKSRRYYSDNKKKRKLQIRDWNIKNQNRVTSYKLNYSARKKSLPDTLTEQELEEIKKHFSYKCALSRSTDIQFDHFICLDSGHAGTFKGNIIPLSTSLNASKNNNNPFEWIKRFQEYQTEFESVVEYLAEQNKLSVEDFKSFVYWCYNNQRSINQLAKDNRNSIDIWKDIKYIE
ncbi:hypothetical protein [Rummeliibacillus pycnus]|uniref:hypothetical protein n=1 Tax=Rummeliibacillus pycnus TaxID=101070 RepID=UPI000C9B2835|nr:hypothetical protein [Rummeliibacillus pycnus]